MSEVAAGPTSDRIHLTRRVDWLELFFDLVFVVVVRQLTDRLHGEPSPAEFLAVALLLVFAWTAWLNITFITNVSGEGGADRRIPVLLSMVGIGLIAVSIPNAFGDGAFLLALGLAIPRVAILPHWVRSRRLHGRGILEPTLIGPGVAALILLTVLLPEPARPWVWLVLVVAPLVVALRGLRSLPVVASHLVERVALFTMIVLGESVVELILAIYPAQSALGWFTSFAGFALICAFFWLYFQNATPTAERVLEHRPVAVLRDVVTVGHYLIVLGLIGVAAGLGSAIEHADEAHLPFGALVALGGGVLVYHLAQLVIASRYGLPARTLLVLSPLAMIIPVLVIVLGRDWAPWLIVVVLTVDTVLHGLLGRVIARRIPDDDEAAHPAAGSAH